jgi:hexosaminidase
VKRSIDLLAFQKLNRLLLHLTDDQGWRVEIKRYPKLTEVGARLKNFSGGTGEGWFYTQDDIRELVAYAGSRYVTIVPEIEMPGHSGAAVASYPELGCGGKPSHYLCASKPGTVEFATNVLSEIMAAFPSPFIHIGADEVRPEPWRSCPDCGPRIKALGREALPADVSAYHVKVVNNSGVPFNPDVVRLEGEFVRGLDQFLKSRGRRMVGWDEIIEGGLKKDSASVVMAWRSDRAVAGALDLGRDVVVSLYPTYYLSSGNIALRETYALEPVPGGTSAEKAGRVLGVQGCVWGEGTPTIRQVDRLSFPRLCALAETGWSAREDRNFEDFTVRLGPFIKRLEALGVTPGASGDNPLEPLR